MRPFCYSNSMRNIILLLICCFIYSPSVFAQNRYKKVEDFSNTYEINVRKTNDKEMAKCQAVRLSRDWYITAAHCFKPLCDSSCEVRARLIVGENYEMDISTKHSSSAPAVFLHERANVDKKVAQYDIALLYFNPQKSEYTYYNPDVNMEIPFDLFMERLFPNQELHRIAKEGTNIPTILTLNTEKPKMLKNSISVISIWDGDKYVLNSTGPVFYSPTLRYIYTENFGIRQGISGSGVMTNTGELVGIVSSTAEIATVITDEYSKQERQAAMSFMASFDSYVMDFLKRHISGLRYKQALVDHLTVVPDEYRPFTDSMEKVEK